MSKVMLKVMSHSPVYLHLLSGQKSMVKKCPRLEVEPVYSHRGYTVIIVQLAGCLSMSRAGESWSLCASCLDQTDPYSQSSHFSLYRFWTGFSLPNFSPCCWKHFL